MISRCKKHGKSKCSLLLIAPHVFGLEGQRLRIGPVWCFISHKDLITILIWLGLSQEAWLVFAGIFSCRLSLSPLPAHLPLGTPPPLKGWPVLNYGNSCTLGLGLTSLKFSGPLICGYSSARMNLALWPLDWQCSKSLKRRLPQSQQKRGDGNLKVILKCTLLLSMRTNELKKFQIPEYPTGRRYNY